MLFRNFHFRLISLTSFHYNDAWSPTDVYGLSSLGLTMNNNQKMCNDFTARLFQLGFNLALLPRALPSGHQEIFPGF